MVQKSRKEMQSGTAGIPKFFDDKGKLRILKQKAFPKTKEGEMAYCDYRIKRWELRKAVAAKRGDPLAKKRTKIEKKKAELEKLEAELEEAESGSD